MSSVRGHVVEYDTGIGWWRFRDTGTVLPNPADLDMRPCVLCHRRRTFGGHDACLGHLPGVTAACCGHGVEDGYVMHDGTTTKLWKLRRAAVKHHPARRDIIRMLRATY